MNDHRSTQVLGRGGVTAATMFAAGTLFVQRRVVRRRWSEMTPQDFLTDFRHRGPRIGIVLFPVELAATVLLGVTTRRMARRSGPGVAVWAGATACEGATVALLLAYFGRANAALMSPAFPVGEARAELGRWRRWNAARAALTALAALLAARGAVLVPEDDSLSRP